MKPFIVLVVFLICFGGFVSGMFVGRDIGIWMTQKEAVRRGKAQFITNEAGEEIWIWKP